jgi:hypothetical protein
METFCSVIKKIAENCKKKDEEKKVLIDDVLIAFHVKLIPPVNLLNISFLGFSFEKLLQHDQGLSESKSFGHGCNNWKINWQIDSSEI